LEMRVDTEGAPATPQRWWPKLTMPTCTGQPRL